MRLWIVVGCAVLILGAALWPFGGRTEQLAPVPAGPSVAAKPTEAPKPEPVKIVEVIDLAQAYEPVREPEEPAGTVNPASFIQVPDGPRQIPPALEWDAMPERIDVMPRIVSGAIGGQPKPISTEGLTASGLFRLSGALAPSPPVEALTVVPGELQGGLLNFVPTKPANGGFNFIPMSVPYATGVTQPIPPNAWIADGPVEALKVLPREVGAIWRMNQLLNESQDFQQFREEWHRSWMNDQPNKFPYVLLNGAIERTEHLDVKPREVK